MLLEEETAVAAAAAVAVTDLIDKGQRASAATPSGFLLQVSQMLAGPLGNLMTWIHL
jgi:hypothetical protein